MNSERLTSTGEQTVQVIAPTSPAKLFPREADPVNASDETLQAILKVLREIDRTLKEIQRKLEEPQPL